MACIRRFQMRRVRYAHVRRSSQRVPGRAGQQGILSVLGCAFMLGVMTTQIGPNGVSHGAESPAAQKTLKVPDLRTRRSGEDWPAFLGPRSDSTSVETGIITDWRATPPRVVWSRPVGIGYGIGTTSRGRLFHFERSGNKARLICLRSETGKSLWKFEYGTDYRDLIGYNNGPRCSPIVDDDRVYIYGAEGMLHCLRVVDGRLNWKVNTGQQFGVVQNFFGVGSTPVVENDLLIVMVGGSPPESHLVPPGELDRVIGNGSGIVAFDKHTGQVRYKITDELASYSVPKMATCNGRRWGFVLARGGLVGFEPSTGRIDFQYPWRARLLHSVNASTPVVVKDEVFISETYGPGSSLLRVRPEGYSVVWKDDPRKRAKAMQTHWNTAVFHEGYLYGSSGRHKPDAELRCVDWKTGRIMWSQPGLQRASLLYVDRHFVCLSEDGVLRLIRATPNSYELVSRIPASPQSASLVRYPAWAAPILSHGLLYIRGSDRLVCLDLIPHSSVSSAAIEHSPSSATRE